MPVLKYWDGAEWIHIGAGGAWSSGDLKQTFLATASDGWLLCDGSLVAQATYPDLFDAIGHSGNGGNDPGGGNFRLPDLREKFTMGKGASQGLMESGGSNDAVAVSHAHTQDAHDHSVTVNTLFGSTGTNNGNTGTDGPHDHTVDGDAGTRILITHGAGVDKMNNGGGGTQVPYLVSTIDTSGAHAHSLGNHSHNVQHEHSAFSGSVAATTQSGGVSGTNKNRPAFVVVNYLIKT